MYCWNYDLWWYSYDIHIYVQISRVIIIYRLLRCVACLQFSVSWRPGKDGEAQAPVDDDSSSNDSESDGDGDADAKANADDAESPEAGVSSNSQPRPIGAKMTKKLQEFKDGSCPHTWRILDAVGDLSVEGNHLKMVPHAACDMEWARSFAGWDRAGGEWESV